MIRNLLIVWIFTGIWHGAYWNFVLWGTYFGILISIEKLFLHNLIEKCPKLLRHIYLLLIIIIGWVFFEFTNISDTLNFLQIMFGIGNNLLIDNQAIITLKNYLPLYIICIVAASSYPKKQVLLFKSKYYSAYTILLNLYYCVLVFFITAYMLASTYNPFIYFRF